MAQYEIGSEKGYQYTQDLKKNPNQTITASDGSQWTTDGSKIYVTKDGVTSEAKVTYDPTKNSASSSGGNTTWKETNKSYYVGTDKGYQGLEDLYSGKIGEFSDTADGSTWYIGSDGKAYAKLNGYIMPIDFQSGGSGWSGGSGGSSGGGSGGISGSILDYLNGLLNGTTGGTVATPSTSTVVDNALAAKDAYNDQIDSYKQQLLAMQNQKTPSAQDQSEYIRQMYEQQLAANRAQLESNYNEGMSNLAGEESNLGANYYEQRRQAQANSDKSQANFNEMANAYGLNTGTGGQAQLARNNQLQSNLTALGNAEAQNRAEIERQRTLLGQQYQNAIQQAQAENNMELAQALYQEAVRVDNSIIDASKNDSNRALEILNMMLEQVSADRSLATEEARQAAEIAAAGGKYGLYGTLYGLSDDVVSQLESIYQKELSDTELLRQLEILEKQNALGVNGMNGLASNLSGRNNSSSSSSSIINMLMQMYPNGLNNLMGADREVGGKKEEKKEEDKKEQSEG